VRTKRWTLIGSIWRAYRPDQMDYFSDKNGVKGSWLGGVRQVSNDPENRWYYITLANGTPMNSGEHGVWFSNWHEAERFLWPHLETYFK
jgi:hypothetical protein